MKTLDEKQEKQDFDLFDAISALDRKDYDYWNNLSSEQQQKFIPYMLLQWMSSVSGSKELQQYYLMNCDQTANKHLFNESIQRHPKLQWLMLCSISPGIGSQRHEWIPQLSKKITKLEEKASTSEIKKYYAKVYPNANSDNINEIANTYVQEQHVKVYFAKNNPNMKLEDIEVLSKLITKEEIQQYEKDNGN